MCPEWTKCFTCNCFAEAAPEPRPRQAAAAAARRAAQRCAILTCQIAGPCAPPGLQHSARCQFATIQKLACIFARVLHMCNLLCWLTFFNPGVTSMVASAQPVLPQVCSASWLLHPQRWHAQSPECTIADTETCRTCVQYGNFRGPLPSCVNQRHLHISSDASPHRALAGRCQHSISRCHALGRDYAACSPLGGALWRGKRHHSTRTASTSMFVTSTAAHLPAEAACPAKWLLDPAAASPNCAACQLHRSHCCSVTATPAAHLPRASFMQRRSSQRAAQAQPPCQTVQKRLRSPFANRGKAEPQW